MSDKLRDPVARVTLHDLTCKDLMAILDCYQAKYRKSALKDDLVALVSEQQARNPHKMLACDPDEGEWRLVDRPSDFAFPGEMPNAADSDEDGYVPPPVPENEIMPEPDVDDRVFHKLKVKGQGMTMGHGSYEIELDGKSVQCRHLSFEADVNDITVVTLELLVDDVEIETEAIEDCDLHQPLTPYDSYMLTALRTLKAAALRCDRPIDKKRATNHIIIREMENYLQIKGLIPIKDKTTKQRVADAIRRSSR